MILSDAEIRRSLEMAKTAFPRFNAWKFNNEVNAEHSGFTLWGEFVPDPDESMPRHFFVTFDTYKKKWRGNLTIGQHQYFWSSADFGDAHLLGTDDCATLEEAITALKAEIAGLFVAFQARTTLATCWTFGMTPHGKNDHDVIEKGADRNVSNKREQPLQPPPLPQGDAGHRRRHGGRQLGRSRLP